MILDLKRIIGSSPVKFEHVKTPITHFGQCMACLAYFYEQEIVSKIRMEMHSRLFGWKYDFGDLCSDLYGTIHNSVYPNHPEILERRSLILKAMEKAAMDNSIRR